MILSLIAIGLSLVSMGISCLVILQCSGVSDDFFWFETEGAATVVRPGRTPLAGICVHASTP